MFSEEQSKIPRNKKYLGLKEFYIGNECVSDRADPMVLIENQFFFKLTNGV